MQETPQDGLKSICAKETWTAEDHDELLRELFAISDAAGKFRGMLAQIEAEHPEPRGAPAVKIGIGRYMVCRFREALEAFAQATDNKDRRYFQGLCYKQLKQYDKAAAEFERAIDRGWEGPEAAAQLVEVLALSGKLDEAQAALAKLEKRIRGTADLHYLDGLIKELGGYGDEAVKAYETARVAYYYDLHGGEEEAVELYRQCASRPPVHANALLNLAVLYEDIGEYDKAAACLKRILATNPTHPRARLFLDQARRLARRNAVLDIPVTDFELSVRARNCLKKMNIRTLGDLVRTTESELLAYKNFGETSLKEIKDMLTAKGLRLGQALEEGSELADLAMPQRTNVSNEGVLATAIEHIEFSIRSRRALESLKIATLGELIAKTDAELLACKNFGQTSLNEVRQRLAEYGLHLREPN